VLELRTGVGAPRALAPAAVAKYLKLGSGQIAPLTQQAVRRLRLAARTHACSAPAQGPSDLTIVGASWPSEGTSGGARGGVEATRYAKSPPAERSGGAQSGGAQSDALLGIHAPPPIARGSLLWIMVALAGVISIGLVLADGLGVGPRHRDPRSPWVRRPPWI
jgi:hypothetical protein